MNTLISIEYNKEIGGSKDKDYLLIGEKRNSIKDIRHQAKNQGSSPLHKRRYAIH